MDDDDLVNHQRYYSSCNIFNFYNVNELLSNFYEKNEYGVDCVK